ncbi:pentatricopeptide repeat-containing protein At5g39350-like [Gastrolobium bilobum]|uniref:pentatricopeptide repeat-containing protein At5g39350-like n=1 Tax=Gastrolobium bilobum TaxID=150636 RepID=UPI002AB28A99|nr:pentatricopeptide repeat-containing protein At5g39350-like [Gastrolobium bilobum]
MGSWLRSHTATPKTLSLFPSELNSVLQACSASKALNQGKQVHQQLVVNGSHRNPFFATKLIQIYADCDDLHSAQLLLHQVSQPNVFAFTSILGFYSRHGLTHQCIETYAELRFKGVLPDGYVFPKVLKACAQSACLKTGAVVHKDVIVLGLKFNLHVCNSMLDMYFKCGDVGSAARVFDEMAERDVFSWNSMMSGYVCNGLLERAVEVLGFMRLDGCEPDVVTWNTVMDAYCRMRLCCEASRVFEQIKDPNVISWTTLISGYSNVGRHDVCLGIFRKMVNAGMVFPDVDALSGILASCRSLGALASGKEIHGYGLKIISGDAFYKSAGAALLTLYASCRRHNAAENVFHTMDKSDVVTWNAMIFGLIDMGLGHLALECFRQMQGRGVKIDHTTISTILPVCDLRCGKQIHAYVRKTNFNCMIPVYNALIHMYSIRGCIAYAYSSFSTMVARDLVSWNTIIGGFGIHGLGQTALKLLREMSDLGIRPDLVTFSSALSACSHSGLVDDGIELFYRMTKDFGLTPVKEHFSCVVDMLARAGRLEDAFHFINQMPLEPDKYIWGALLAACQEHQNVSVGKLAAEKLISLEPQEAGHYVTLSNIYSKAGRWNDASRIRKMMEGQGLLKPSGHSLVGTGS